MVHVLELVLAAVLLATVPILSIVTARRANLRLIPRIDLYLSAAFSQWILALFAGGIFWLEVEGFSKAGFKLLESAAFWKWTAGLTAGTLAALGLMMVLEERGLWPSDSDLVEILIPRTPREKLIALVLVAPTAAVCEELLYRGFLYARLAEWTDSVGWAIVLASLAFGLAHAYQGFHGMVRAGMLGAVLTIPLIRTGSLYPSIASHFLIDAVALVWLGPRFLAESQKDE